MTHGKADELSVTSATFIRSFLVLWGLVRSVHDGNVSEFPVSRYETVVCNWFCTITGIGVL